MRQAFAHRVAAQAVDGDVHAMTRIQLLLHDGGQTLTLRVDDAVCAQRRDGGHLIVVPHGGDDARAECLRHGNGDAGQSACAGGDQHGVARLHPALDEQEQIGRAEHLGQRRGFLHGKPLRDGHEHIGGHGHIFGIAAAAQQRAHLVADVPFALGLRLCAQRLNHARGFETVPFRPAGRRGILSRALEQIGAVERGGVDFEQNVVLAQCGIGDLCPVQLFILTLEYSVHDKSSFFHFSGRTACHSECDHV